MTTDDGSGQGLHAATLLGFTFLNATAFVSLDSGEQTLTFSYNPDNFDQIGLQGTARGHRDDIPKHAKSELAHLRNAAARN